MPLRIDAPHHHPRKREKLFSGNKNPRFWDIRQQGCTPENAKSFFPEIRTPVFGTSDSRVAPPENAKSFFPEIRTPVFGTSDKIIRAKWPPFSNMVSFL
jgi:hypothetical protein